MSNFICAACQNPIENKATFIEGFPYHKECIKCMIRGCTFNSISDEHSKYTVIQPGLFFCNYHYKEYLISKLLPSKIEKQIKENQIRSILQKTFFPPPFLHDCIDFDKPYDIFLPTLEFKFDTKIDDFDFESLQNLFGERAIIVDAKRGSTNVKAVVPYLQKFGSNTLEIAQKEFTKAGNELVDQLSKELTEKTVSGIGKLIQKIKNRNPNKRKIKAFLNLPCNNLLKIQFKKGEIDITDIMIKITDIARNDNFVKLAKQTIRIEEEFRNAEVHIKEDLRSNPYEIHIMHKNGVNSPEIQSQYCQLLGRFPSEAIEERYLYYGCCSSGNLNNQMNLILNQKCKHLLNAYYLSNNSFYSCFDGNQNYGPLDVNGTCFIAYCKTFYNKEYLDDLLPVPNKPAQAILLNKGAIRCYIGDSNNNFLPLNPTNSSTQNPFAIEYILNDSKQILPLFIFEVIRNDYFILWRNDEVDSSHNRRIIDDLSRRLQVNVYGCKTDDEALSLIRRKINNKIKLITNHCSNLIDQVRSIVGSNFLCLVYSNSMNEMDRIQDRENILVTNDETMFHNFARLEMEESALLQFIENLQNQHNTTFNINNTEMLRFPYFIQQIPFDQSITTSNSIV